MINLKIMNCFRFKKHLITIASFIFLILFASPFPVAAVQPASFYDAPVFATGNKPLYDLADGDFNGDGRDDILSSDDYNVYVFFGDGLGNFSQPPKILYRLDTQAMMLPAAGDFNGDGRSDVVVPVSYNNNGVSRGVTVFLGNRDGTFSSPVHSDSSDVPTAMLPVDFDGDGKLDIIGSIVSYGDPNKIFLLRGNGNGSFTLAAQFNTGYQPIGVTAADFDGDRLPDLTYRNSDDLMLVKNAGNGTFAQPVSIGHISYGYTSIASADLDKDGKQDIVAVQNTYFDPAVKILLGNGNLTFRDGGNFTFPSRENVFIDQIGDVDRDGNLDLVFTSQNRVVVYNGAGNGSFANPNEYVAGGRDSLLRDFDSDGWLDIASVESAEFAVGGSGGFAVLRNLRDGTFLSAPALPTGDDTKDVAAGDFNADGFEDLVVVKRGAGGGPGDIILIVQQPNAQTTKKSLGAGGINSLSQYGLDPYAVVTGDFNQDGKTDFIVVGRGGYGEPQNALVALNDGAGNFNQPTFFQINSNDIYTVKTADFNGDGKLDLLTTGVFQGAAISFGTGGGSFAAPVNYQNGTPSGATAVGDFNNDAKPDFAVVSYSGGKATILLNNGVGSFTVAGNFAVSGLLNAVAASDLNGDNNLDLVVATSVGVSVLTGNGNGTLNGEARYQILPYSAAGLAIADFNGDKKPDVALLAGTNTVSVLLNDGFGRLGNETLWASGATLQTIIAEDLNNDKKIDIVTGFTSFSTGYINILFNISKEKTVTSHTRFDYDGDGRADVSVYRPTSGVWYLLNSQTGFSGVQFGISTDKIVPADYDGDGRTDIAVYRDGIWYLQRSNAGFTAVNFGLSTDIPMPADFDGDGKAELAVYRPSNGYWYTLNLANNQFGSVQFGAAEDKPVAADYDGDGKSDYAVYRPSSGVWYMLQSAKGFGAVQFGISTDRPVVGDYDGDGKADQAVYRVYSGDWFINKSAQGFASINFGLSTDIPAAADFDGDGRTDVAVFRPENGVWYQLKSTEGFGAPQFGLSNDKPTPNAFVR